MRLESQIGSPPITSTGTWRWPVSASISPRSPRRKGTRTCSCSTFARRSARATVPHGHSQAVGVMQRYSVAMVQSSRRGARAGSRSA